MLKTWQSHFHLKLFWMYLWYFRYFRSNLLYFVRQYSQNLFCTAAFPLLYRMMLSILFICPLFWVTETSSPVLTELWKYVLFSLVFCKGRKWVQLWFPHPQPLFFPQAYRETVSPFRWVHLSPFFCHPGFNYLLQLYMFNISETSLFYVPFLFHEATEIFRRWSRSLLNFLS